MDHRIIISKPKDGTVILLIVPSKLFPTHFPRIKTVEAVFCLY